MQTLIDLHTHTTRCCHATGTMEAYVEQALAKGIHEFGFSDHSHWMLHARGQRYAMLAEEHDDYIADVRRLQERYSRDGDNPFRIRLGMEMDFIPSRLDIARDTARSHAWDYLIGSIHNIGFEKLQEPEMYDSWHIEDVCEIYFHFVGMMIRERFCDIVGHLDLPKKMGRMPAGGMLRYIEPLIPALLANDIAVEINTSGFDHPAQAFMPGWEVVEALASHGVPLTLGSDAHAPHQVGRHFAQALEGLRKIGVKQLVRFERRQMIAVPIETASG